MRPTVGQQRLPIALLGVLILLCPSATTQKPPTGQRSVPITLEGCSDKCGNISIPFPFGMERSNCFLEGFEVVCNHTFNPPRAFLSSAPSLFSKDWPPNFATLSSTVFQLTANMYYSTVEASMPSRHIDHTAGPVELLDVAVERGQARVYAAVSSDCSRNQTYHALIEQSIKLPPSSPFLFSAQGNELVGVGKSAVPILSGSLVGSDYQARCQSFVSSPGVGGAVDNGSCTTLGCCHQDMPSGINSTRLLFFHENRSQWETYPCAYGMLVQKSWYNFSPADMEGYLVLARKYPRGVPVVLDFAIRNASCPPQGQGQPSALCRSANSQCVNATNGPGYVCRCMENYSGNPYISDGCQDIDECALRDQNPSYQIKYPCIDGRCVNRLGGYDCPCNHGMKGDGKTGSCTEKFPMYQRYVVGAIGGVFVLVVALFIVLLCVEKQKTRNFFEKNGGPAIQRFNNIKIFRKEELKPILKSSNLIGKGCFGEVYKGSLIGQQVAVKKPINVHLAQKEQFANEIEIQSHMIHKNIVKLIGCCLEVDIPILVYEFVSKGSLDGILHGDSREKLSLHCRLNIAAESAEGLAYMHSKTSTTILHGDVKPANILLDDKFTPKISDFGISRMITVDTPQQINYVIGDRAYMDPAYIRTGLLKKKSDVYSFGIVLMELITRTKPTYTDIDHLIKTFIDAHKRRSIDELIDREIMGTTNIMLLDSIVQLAVECLNHDVDQRPEMTDVADRLLELNKSIQ